MKEHEFYTTSDKNAPDVIKDRNGEVVLQLCKRCNLAEGELYDERNLVLDCKPLNKL